MWIKVFLHAPCKIHIQIYRLLHQLRNTVMRCYTLVFVDCSMDLPSLLCMWMKRIESTVTDKDKKQRKRLKTERKKRRSSTMTAALCVYNNVTILSMYFVFFFSFLFSCLCVFQCRCSRILYFEFLFTNSPFHLRSISISF